MSATSSSSVAAGLLRIGQSVLFGVLLLIGVVRGVADRGWSVGLAGAAIAALFVTGLVTHRSLGPKGRAVWVVTLLVATVALMWVSPDFVWLAFPAWMWLAQVVSLPLALTLTATSVALAIAALNQHGQYSSAAVLGPIIGALVAVGLARGALRLEHEGQEHQRLLARVLQAQAEADALSEELVRAQRESAVNAERSRLAHDIHDTLAQGFSSILLLARAAARETDPERAQDLLTQIRAAATENLAESRRVVYALAPDDLTTGGLAAPLTRMTTELGTHLNADVTLDLDPNLPRLHTATEVAILRAAQGALANVRRHAGASHVRVTLARADDQVRLDIVDDGVGFDPTAVAAEPTLAGGYGLRALRERLTAIGGGLAIESEPGQGTAISVTVPFVRSAGETP